MNTFTMSSFLKTLFFGTFLATAILACSPKDPLASRPEDKLDPLNGTQAATFDQIISGLGRPEQVIRLMTATEPSWGITDPATTTFQSDLTAQGCTVQLKLEPNAKNQFRRLLQISGTTCPVQLQYSLEQTVPGQPFYFNGSYLITSDTLVAANGVRGMSMSWKAVVYKRASGSEFLYRWELAGTGKILTGENLELAVKTQVRMEKGTNVSNSRNVGYYRTEITGPKTYYLLLGEYLQDSLRDTSKFRINGTFISKDAFETYLSKLGFLVGIDSFNEAG